MVKTLIDQANEKLRRVQKELIKIQIEQDLVISNLSLQAHSIRQTLVDLRKSMDMLEQNRKVRAIQAAIHEALVFFAKHFPLNHKTAGNQYICPYSKKAFEWNDGIALSNGCLYHEDWIGGFAKGRQTYPKILPGSHFEIDKEDIKIAQDKPRRRLIGNGMELGVFFGGVLLGIAGLIPLAIGAGSLVGLLSTALVGLGIGATLGAILTGGILMAPIIIGFVVGAIVGAVYYSKKYPSQFAAKKNKDSVTSSTAQTFEKLDAKPGDKLDVQPAPVIDDEAKPLLDEVRMEQVIEPPSMTI